jgi:hypothetical protein
MRRTRRTTKPASYDGVDPLSHDATHADCKKLVIGGHPPNQLSCVHPLLATAFRAVSDALPQTHRQQLVALAARLIDTADIDPLVVDSIVRRLVERAVFIVLPDWRNELQRELRVLDARPGQPRSERDFRREQRVIQHAILSIALVSKEPESELMGLLTGLLSVVPD